MPDSLNERMAAALAPVLGETAVYRAGRCQRGHLATALVQAALRVMGEEETDA